MFNKLFSRTAPQPNTAVKSLGEGARPNLFNERRRIQRPLPTAQIVEGDGSETDWALWLEATQTSETKGQPVSQTNRTDLNP
jgi:hypothetical protein